MGWLASYEPGPRPAWSAAEGARQAPRLWRARRPALYVSPLAETACTMPGLEGRSAVYSHTSVPRKARLLAYAGRRAPPEEPGVMRGGVKTGLRVSSSEVEKGRWPFLSQDESGRRDGSGMCATSLYRLCLSMCPRLPRPKRSSELQAGVDVLGRKGGRVYVPMPGAGERKATEPGPWYCLGGPATACRCCSTSARRAA